ncbi:hypothetical protein [Cellulomonas biazotea]|uniref:Uncharacterized protein n=1 Tax=Cellulomonas biazotea TaxID=1709 RepID=A0A402DUG0_9CELL|nr:hypothetical protein [Cellulomonas biazotea]GCE77781.1 hypothetical protein CBZ_28370 [Cellulomonas biazotea]
MTDPPGPATASSPALTTDQTLLVWSTLAARRTSFDGMVWQTPALGLAAQAFLLTLALGPGTSPLGRAVSAGLSLALSVMVIQLLLKHRQSELGDSLTLERIERALGLDASLGTLPHGSPAERSTPTERRILARATARLTPPPRRFWSMSSVRLWVAGQWLFAAVALLVVALVVSGSQVLG